MRQAEDRHIHKGLRKALVEKVRGKGITDEQVLAALNAVPRHFFLDSAFDRVAYEDRAFPIGEGQTISQPYTVACQTQLLQLRPYDKVLEIGTGSAYQACILAELKAQVYTIERQRKLYDINRQFEFLKTYPRIHLFYGDGFQGLPTFAPFDRVLVTAAAPVIPQNLIAQLKPGGMMVIPVNEGEMQRMVRITRLEGSETKEERFELFSFVPMLEGKEGG